MKNIEQHELPPVLEILLREGIETLSLLDAHARLKEMHRDLIQQAEWTIDNFAYAENDELNAGQFITYPMSGMNPMGEGGACQSVVCRENSAANFARTIGLYSDVAILTDPFTVQYLELPAKLSVAETASIIRHLRAARVLEPFLRAGVFRFRSGFVFHCSSCRAKLVGEMDSTIESYVNEHILDFRLEALSEKWAALESGNMVEPALVTRIRLTKRTKIKLSNALQRDEVVRDMAVQIVRREVWESVMGASDAAHLNAVVLSNSRAGLAGLLRFEKRLPPRTELDFWELNRSAELPWINSLTPTEALRLRSEAATALPRFRALLANALRARSATDIETNPQQWTALVRNLREEAAEVSAEIATIDVTGGKGARNLVGLAGLGIAMYGLGADQPAVSFAGLLSALALVHPLGRRESQDHARQLSRPGYVLVKAQQILEHRH